MTPTEKAKQEILTNKQRIELLEQKCYHLQIEIIGIITIQKQISNNLDRIIGIVEKYKR